MSFYSEMAAMANDLLSEFGQSVTLTNYGNGAYDPATGAANTDITIQTGWGAIFDISNRDIDGTVIQQGDKQLLLASIGISAPQVNDTVLSSCGYYTIKSVKATSPAGTPVVYDCLLRSS